MYTIRVKPKTMQKRFLSKIGDIAPFRRLIDLLPDVSFFMKDSDGRFMLNNLRACEFCNANNENETIGKTDYDFFSKDRADFYVRGDREVMQSGVPVINEIAPAPEHSDRLMVHSKFAVCDKRGKPIGVVGFYRIIDDLRDTPRWHGRFAEVMAMMHSRYGEGLDIKSLAKMAGVSQSQFERRFNRIFGTTPYEYLLRVRIAAARALLENSERTIADIACETGFYDHSHFTRTFKRIVGISPGRYRAIHSAVGM
ncbi:MAG: AraC family transcriptional regulator [Kiritimatiellae bacterium]|nr:AraC family transcriptional regulator [Kiritimatiellia bacterium]